MKKLVYIVISLTFILSMVLIQAIPVSACGDGKCYTPGYWKNHTDTWPGYGDTTTTLGQLFEYFSYSVPQDLPSGTMLEALQFKGGPGVDGAAKILMRAGVASFLNEQNECYYEGCVIEDLYNALCSGNRAIMIELAEELDAFNNSCSD